MVDAGAVIQGSLDGILRVYDDASGSELWRYDTMRGFDTVNGGSAAHGPGAIDSSPMRRGERMLFVVSGYGRFGEAPGNVLLASSSLSLRRGPRGRLGFRGSRPRKAPA